MKRSKRFLIEVGIIAAITTAAICLFFNFEGVSVTTVEQEELQSPPFQVITEEMLATTDGHAEIKWVKTPNWQKIMTLFFNVFLIYILVRSAVVWLLSIQLNKHRE